MSISSQGDPKKAYDATQAITGTSRKGGSTNFRMENTTSRLFSDKTGTLPNLEVTDPTTFSVSRKRFLSTPCSSMPGDEFVLKCLDGIKSPNKASKRLLTSRTSEVPELSQLIKNQITDSLLLFRDLRKKGPEEALKDMSHTNLKKAQKKANTLLSKIKDIETGELGVLDEFLS